jgi:hypothetical protein
VNRRDCPETDHHLRLPDPADILQVDVGPAGNEGEGAGGAEEEAAGQALRRGVEQKAAQEQN